MKLVFFLLISFIFIGCDPSGFGFKQNPTYVLKKAFEAMIELNEKEFLKISGKEALCVYGNPSGLAYLRDHFTMDPANIELKASKLRSAFHGTPLFIGYWSYYTESYSIDVLDKTNQEVKVRAEVECDYGLEGKRPSLVPEHYSKKECRLIKVSPTSFPGMEIPSRCDIFKSDSQPLKASVIVTDERA